MINNKLLTRYEFKYFINNQIAKSIFEVALNFMNVDDFALRSKNKGYFVRSLYYDNPQYDNFFEKVDGMQVRKKFRLRTYENKYKKNSIFYLEMKGRKQDRIIKKRTQIKIEDLKYFYSLNNLNKLQSKYHNDVLIEDFIFSEKRKKIRPRILIDYSRKPLINKYGLYFRLTFDSNIIVSKSKSLFLEKNFNFPIKYNPGNTVLEVKFERSIPAWFHRVIQTYSLNRKSISKFVIGVCACKEKSDTSD